MENIITVIYKKGDVTNPENYMAICGLPQLYKLSSTVPYNRLYAEFDRYLCPDQARFRKTFYTTDHFKTYRLISRTGREWETDMWVAAIDLTKAFDSFQHAAIWGSLRNHSVTEQYICLLKNCTLINAPPYRLTWKVLNSGLHVELLQIPGFVSIPQVQPVATESKTFLFFP